MTLAIIGSCTFSDYDLLCRTMDQWFPSGVTEVVSGGARGADRLGAQWAREQDIPVREFLPDWDTHGKRAGYLRNVDIVAAADVVLAFWDAVSKGTGHSLTLAKKSKKTTLIVYV